MKSHLQKKSTIVQFFWYLVGALRSGLDDPSADLGQNPPEEMLPTLRENYNQLQRGFQQSAYIPAPLVSIVIPVRVSEKPSKFLMSMQSLLKNQDTPPTEVIVVLNEKLSALEIKKTSIAGLVDEIGFRSVIVSYTDHPEYRDIDRPMHIFVARQAGAEKAMGEIIIQADIDDVFAPKWIRAYVDAFVRNPQLLLAYGPVAIYGTIGVTGKLMAWTSTIAKAVKILIKYPPYAGHNHAMRKEVITTVSDLYTKRIILHENEIPIVIGKALALPKGGHYVVCVPKAIIKTDYSKMNQTIAGAVRWAFKSSCRNIQQMRRLWTV